MSRQSISTLRAPPPDGSEIEAIFTAKSARIQICRLLNLGLFAWGSFAYENPRPLPALRLADQLTRGPARPGAS